MAAQATPSGPQILTPERANQLVSSWQRDPIDRFRVQQQIDRYRFASDNPQAFNYYFSRMIEEYVQWILEQQGYSVNQTVNSAPFDLWVDDCLRVEVKAAHWTPRAGRPQYGRYQAAIRNRTADFVVFDCINGTHHFFIIPGEVVGERRTLEVTSHNVYDYSGRWAPYLNSWNLIAEFVAQVEAHPKQLEMGNIYECV